MLIQTVHLKILRVIDIFLNILLKGLEIWVQLSAHGGGGAYLAGT